MAGMQANGSEHKDKAKNISSFIWIKDSMKSFSLWGKEPPTTSDNPQNVIKLTMQ